MLHEEGILRLPIEDEHALHVLDLPRHHRDPFDRMLVAQAQIEGLALVTGDQELRAYDVEVLW
jgi:PIN domain nuclease of toxin-antitoxin system